VEKQTEATLYGNAVHKALELDLKGEQPLPEKFKDYRPLTQRIKMTPGKKIVEQKIALTKGFAQTTYFGNDVWLRAVIDVGVIQPTKAVVMDWKTGKPKTDSDQMKLFAAVAFQTYPHIESVDTAFVWLGHNKIDKQTFKRDETPVIWQDFTRRVSRIEHAVKSGDFPPKPSGLCREWCPVGRKLCEFCGGN
jgi:hypothetical protein